MTDLPFPDTLPNERWRPVPGFPAYAVSTAHRWRRRYTRREAWTAPRTTPMVHLRRRTGYSVRRVTALVALAFDDTRTEPPSEPTRRPRPLVGKLATFVHLLGTMPDQAVADAAGVTRARVQQARRRLDIPAAPTETHICKLAAADRRADVESVRSRLGTEPDAAIAAELGLSRELVRAIRLEFGIAPCRTRSRASCLDPFAHLIGTVPDRQIAEMAGCSVPNVTVYRRRRGIRSSRSRRAA